MHALSIGRMLLICVIILQEHDLKPWQQKSWCVPELTDEFIARMEDMLLQYEKEYSSSRPLICIDEKPIPLWLILFYSGQKQCEM
jgi:hypothetical protein